MLDAFERYPLTFGPTPIELLNRLSEALGMERFTPNGTTATTARRTAGSRSVAKHAVRNGGVR